MSITLYATVHFGGSGDVPRLVEALHQVRGSVRYVAPHEPLRGLPYVTISLLTEVYLGEMEPGRRGTELALIADINRLVADILPDIIPAVNVVTLDFAERVRQEEQRIEAALWAGIVEEGTSS